ncbi:MAG: NYN domain-containing protein [Candidatus Moranbacteria bacterium]|nr:NYN domain-containing protein [Candidatus Moranbacteria bacterium]
MPIGKFSDQRVGVLVDIQNMYYSARVLYKKKVNFKEILKAGVANRKLIRAIAYGIKTTEGLEKNFFDALQKSGYEVRTKDLQIFPGGAKKGDWDVGITVDAIKLAGHLDVIVLVTGDGDYIPLVEYLQNTKGCRVEVIAFSESASAKLIESADDFINLSDSKKKFLI